MSAPTLLTGWGRATASPSTVDLEHSTAAVVDLVRRCLDGGAPRGLLARGLGRSYGDAALNAGGRVLSTERLTAVGEIHPDGVVDVGAGVSVADLLALSVPRGWFVPVTPGTRFVSVGGAVAADVHGKNHHRDGSIGRHVEELDLVDGTATLHTLRPGDAAFEATLGGMGLTGVITRVRLRMRPIETASVTVHTRRTPDLEATMAALEEADRSHRYTVAWLDTLAPGRALGRGVLTSGDHSPRVGAEGGRPTALEEYGSSRMVPAPRLVPSGLVRTSTMRAFNEAYYRRAPGTAEVGQESFGRFFYPLDVVEGWNRIYGPRGFLQYQFAVADAAVVQGVLEMFRAAKVPGSLAVLKRFGPASPAPLSFPAPGWTLALDMPALPAVHTVLDRADELVVGAGGRIYLAKDSRMRPELLPQMYPSLERWRAARAVLDPHGLFVSDLSRRLGL